MLLASAPGALAWFLFNPLPALTLTEDGGLVQVTQSIEDIGLAYRARADSFGAELKRLREVCARVTGTAHLPGRLCDTRLGCNSRFYFNGFWFHGTEGYTQCANPSPDRRSPATHGGIPPWPGPAIRSRHGTPVLWFRRVRTRRTVICCDGTGNEIGETISNVLKLYRILTKTNQQRVYYNPGVGTIGLQNTWQRFKQQATGVFGLATGYGLDNDVLSAYRFLCETYEDGDQIWLFGFSRGAYTVRVLAAFLHVIGLLRSDQLNIAGYAFAAYKKASADRAPEDLSIKEDAGSHKTGLAAAWHFGRVAGGRAVRIAFIGVWDTVASVIVPRADTLLPDLQTLRYTRTNSSVKTFRQAIAIDERRRMFRINPWTEPQTYRPNPFDPTSAIPQDIRQVWFSGVHADIGGGYPESESGLSKFPLLWMIEEAAAKGLRVNRAMINHLVLGRPRTGSRHCYVPPDSKQRPHNSMNAAWRVLEWLPKSAKWQERQDRRVIFGHYFPQGEPRLIPEGAFVHRSVLDQIKAGCGYNPPNLPNHFEVEESSGADGRTGTAGADDEEL